MAGKPDNQVFRISDLIVFPDKENKEVHIKDANDTYYGAVINNEKDLKELITTLVKVLKTTFGK